MKIIVLIVCGVAFIVAVWSRSLTGICGWLVAFLGWLVIIVQAKAIKDLVGALEQVLLCENNDGRRISFLVDSMLADWFRLLIERNE